MKSKDEIERTKSILKLMRRTMPPVLFVVLMVVQMGVLGMGFWLSAFIALVLAGAGYIAFSLMLNRWAGL